MGRKRCGKRRNCSLRAISLFPHCFEKACFSGMSKGVIVWEWVNNIFQDSFNKILSHQLTHDRSFISVYPKTVQDTFITYSFGFNPFPNKPWFLRVCRTSLLKTLWEKEKLFVTSNFSFSHSIFYPFG